MRSLLHFLAILLALPQVLLSAAFLLFGHVISGGTLGSFFLRLLEVFNAIFTWGGLLVIVLFLTLTGLGFHERTRRAAAAVVAAIVIMSAVILIIQLGGANLGDALVFFVPGVFALV